MPRPASFRALDEIKRLSRMTGNKLTFVAQMYELWCVLDGSLSSNEIASENKGLKRMTGHQLERVAQLLVLEEHKRWLPGEISIRNSLGKCQFSLVLKESSEKRKV